MFKGIKNQFLAKMQVEKFLSIQFVKFIIKVEMLVRSDLSKEEILSQIMNIKDTIIKQYNLTDKDIINEN